MINGSVGSLADPPDVSVLVAAVGWIESTALGSFATTIAVIAVATIGIAMLFGRTDVRRGLTVLFGCFMLFGAASIADGLRRVAQSSGTDLPVVAEEQPPSTPIAAPPQRVPQPMADPYAGAAVPR